ncbi:MAG TPA: Gfo/Idh/MocA family oxidoreductase [Candidatus Aminicenantes bacterium]|nr:Gfo/Idh/MocA family oxidoreductase [Candidatus Aminicenantes bacterium]HRY65300.1 Gfo/Idh/MocA family oxidoreductase [Candidatus Aminicenantes bacterium]HRZ72232.1 Gfo/Idh/MocA family oxidoreductase [Candidatus Aminicenantes bacterium]
MSRIKVGLVGTGYIGQVHLEMLRRLGGVEVVAVADPNEELAKAAAERFAVGKVYAGADELVADPAVEVVHDCAPNNVHFDVNAKAIQAGKEVLSEKPLALDARESGRLLDLAEKHGTLTAIDFCYRYYPVVQEAAARARRGDLGEVRAFVGHFLQDWLFFETDYTWRLDPRVAGQANVIADLGSHWFDLVQFVTGQKIVEVMAELHTCLPTRRRPKGGVLSFGAGGAGGSEEVAITLDDYASVFLKLANGARGNFTTCQAAAGRKVDLELQVFGSKESYAWSHVRPNELWIGHREKANEVFYESPQMQAGETRRYALLPTGHPIGYHDAVFNLFRDYYEALAAKRAGKPFRADFPDFRTGHEMMRVIDAAVESDRAGRWARVRI